MGLASRWRTHIWNSRFGLSSKRLHGFEGSSGADERREKNLILRILKLKYSLKKKALNVSSKFKYSLKKKSNKRKSNSRVSSVSIEDIRDAEELQAVESYRQDFILDELLPEKLDDYHIMLRNNTGKIFCKQRILWELNRSSLKDTAQ
ncbi:phosphatidylinositol/phosphatidylcholine transfer protein SFH6-like [Forsythia ovata]|uniref:Phosphatidylinositol/phosphatidylcholine transfer protein SFH6-like n=1 Tax=Forsythia ovata TaxID=205694 RepID=A0ABD1RJG2_9LAMI